MKIEEIKKALTSGNQEEILAVAEMAVDALEILEERIAIIGEMLTKKEWEEVEQTKKHLTADMQKSAGPSFAHGQRGDTDRSIDRLYEDDAM